MLQIDGKSSPLSPLTQEWLETDGRGGYASSTLSGCHTRRYHGLLVANLPAPEGRHVLLSKLEDTLLAEGEELFLTAHRYPGLLFPPGPPPPAAFVLGLHPSFLYRAGRLQLRKDLLLVRERGILLVRYRLEKSAGDGRLRLKPFLAFRDYHALARENPFLRSRTEAIKNGFTIAPYAGMPPLFVTTSGAALFLPSPCWYKNFEYHQERERGFDWQEDLFLPGTIEATLAPGEPLILAVGYTPPGEPLPEIWDGEITRRRRETAREVKPAGLRAGRERDLFRTLLRAGRQFLIVTPSGRPAIIAGYPWFGCWGRDALISLPGLAFACGRVQEGIEILTEIGRHERDGLLPNFFSGDGTPAAYNTVDSSLFFFWAVQELLRVTGDAALIRERFWPVMKRIVQSFRSGTRYGIGMDANGLLRAGEAGLALTWMDACVDGVPVTPRRGCVVEINALWYNALALTRDLAARFAEPAGDLDDLLPRLQRSFQETFWSEEDACLGDVYHQGRLDRAIRPNQIFAVSLPFSPLTPAQQAGVVRKVREHLLTPCGLRTLSPTDPAYRGLYRGNGAERDAAYHQGTVWPWLLGPFGAAALRVATDPKGEREALRASLAAFLSRHFREAGIGTISEVFDGDPPHQPGGCIAQAWSIAELIRLYRLLLET